MLRGHKTWKHVTCVRGEGTFKVESINASAFYALRLTIHFMASPSQPVAIKSPRLLHDELSEGVSTSVTPIGTPADQVRVIRAQYAGTPPIVPNIPPRGLTPARSGPSSLIPTSDPFPLRPGPQVVGGISALSARISNPSLAGKRSETPPVVDLDTLPDEEKAKVLRQLLSFPQERQNNGGEARSVAGSDQEAPGESGQTSPSRPSSSGVKDNVQADQEPFPIPYHAPGADVT